MFIIRTVHLIPSPNLCVREITINVYFVFFILFNFFTKCDYSSANNYENETDSSSLTQEQLKISSTIER